MGFIMLKQRPYSNLLLFLILTIVVTSGHTQQKSLVLNEQEYFEMPGLNIMIFHDFYPEGHQGGISIIQNGTRVASNGDLRLEFSPGQWQPVPKAGERLVDIKNQLVSVPCTYPNPDLDMKGFNPIKYPDLHFNYRVNVKAEGASFRIFIDLDEPIPSTWIGKVGFNLELFPGDLFGKTYIMDDKTGFLPRQLNGPMIHDKENNFQIEPLAEGKKLVVAPECDAQRMTITTLKGKLKLLDGRAHHNNGWFIIRTEVPEGATKSAVEWIISPNVLPDWRYEPVIHLSQIGYHLNQEKIAVIECDSRDNIQEQVLIKHILPDGELKTIKSGVPEIWGKFLRYQYLRYDFSEIKEDGLYILTYGNSESQPLKISKDVFNRHVWQPILEYFLPVQMCHMRINDRYRVWHGLCHLDDALMAAVDTIHFDGYRQGNSTLTSYKPFEHVPGLNVGGWHDAGDYDLRVESQAGTVYTLSLIFETFNVQYDETTIDQQNRLVEIHRPDGKPDILQQIEHGVLSILGGYKNLGRLYRGIICSNLRQYVLLGDGSTMTDNMIYNPNLSEDEVRQNESGKFDDRWVFTEENPRRELYVAGCLAAASRVLKKYNQDLSVECLQTAEDLLAKNDTVSEHSHDKITALAELILTTNKSVYKDQLVAMLPQIEKSIGRTGWALGRVLPFMDKDQFNKPVTDAVHSYYQDLQEDLKENPFGVPYRPHIWGAGWIIQRFGVQQYYLHTAWPDVVPKEHILNALNFILGCHPGPNTASFASGVGINSLTVAYGVNRADWSYIPGGVASGTAYIRPDFPELKVWPFLWQQTEYVVGGGASNFMFLVLAAKQLLEVK